jgi:hypothetical protein
MRMVLAHGNGRPGAWGARAILRTPLTSGGVGRNSCWLSIAIGSVPTQEPRSPRSSTEPSFLGPERSDAPAQATAIKPSGELIFAIESGTLDCENFELWTPIGHWQRLRARGISRGTHSDESSRFLVPSLSTLRMWARLMEQIRLLELLFRRMPETRKRLAPTISPKLHKCLRFCPSWQRPWSQPQLLLDFATASCAACIAPITRAIDSRSDARCGTR